MADTAHDVQPETKHLSEAELNRLDRLEDGRLHHTHIKFGAPIPPASEVDLATLDMSDQELWKRDAIWDRFARLRKEAPVHYCPDSPVGPYWSVTRYEDIMAVDTDHIRLSSDAFKGGITMFDMDEDFVLPMFIAMDQPKHDEQRKVVQPSVGPNMLRSYEPLIRERTAKIFDSLPVGEEFDWVDKVSVELTGMMLATLFGTPQEDRRKLTRWSDVATGRENEEICPGGEEQWRAELLECLTYFTEVWNDRVKQNEPGHDLISMLAHGEATKNMDPMEYLGNLILLIVGGNDTTRNSMSGSIYSMNLFPSQFELLKSRHDLIPNAVSEVIRWQTPLAHMRRTANVDLELGGQQIKAGDKVVMWYVSGNRDESHFERPNEIWIERPKVRSHLSFGYGIHRCVGNRLGEMQLRIMWEEFFKRFSHAEVIREPKRTRGAFVKGYVELPVVLTGR